MKRQQNIFAVILLCFAGLGIGYSQTNTALYHRVFFGANAITGLNKFDRHISQTHPDYPDSYVPSFKFGYTFGISFNNTLFLDLNADMNYGIHNFKTSEYRKKEDILAYLNFGYKFFRNDIISFDAGIGFGTSVSNVFASYVSNGNDVLLSFQSTHLVVPLSVSAWIGEKNQNGITENKIGVFLQYMFPIAQSGNTTVTGLSTTLDDAPIMPATLTLGLKYRF